MGADPKRQKGGAKMRKIFSFDAETNGLLGRAFALSAVVLENGIETARFIERCPIEGEVDGWVKENVLPQMADIPVTCTSYEEMLRKFFGFFKEHKNDSDVIFHMGLPVEARVIIDAHDLGILGAFEGAYPWIDLSGVLLGKGFDPTTVDGYNASHNIVVSMDDVIGGTHNPLYDSRAAALCYLDLMRG